jgi:beta-fructofuranosidase
MYEDFVGHYKTMGDVDVLYVDGIFHLFHLVLPNHDFIAHSISSDGLHWTRVNNAVFIGHPGNFDDSMLWTMHVSPDPHQPGHWRMFYTGLARRDRQLKQRIGLAVSSDLMTWEKCATKWEVADWQHPHGSVKKILDSRNISQAYDPNSAFPIEPVPPHYESSIDEGRQWVSWRDPFFFQHAGRKWLLCSARIGSGPVIRRGCVALLEEVSQNYFEARPPIFHPGLYDDIEVPNLICIDDEFYLVGSIREDAKIRYWHAPDIQGPWRSHYDNVLLPRGNYAARISRDDHGWLIWNIYSRTANRKVSNLMPPPKRLKRQPDGLLHAVSFEGFEDRVIEKCSLDGLTPLHCCQASDHPQAETSLEWKDDTLRLVNEAGLQSFVFPGDMDSFRFRAQFKLEGLGKCGLVARINRETRDGYYLSLDLLKGIAQFRAWGTNCQATGEDVMNFRTVQPAYWHVHKPGEARFELLMFGSYVEFSIDGRVVLSLVDEVYERGAVGFYLESARACVQDVSLERLTPPDQHDDHLTVG